MLKFPIQIYSFKSRYVEIDLFIDIIPKSLNFKLDPNVDETRNLDTNYNFLYNYTHRRVRRLILKPRLMNSRYYS